MSRPLKPCAQEGCEFLAFGELCQRCRKKINIIKRENNKAKIRGRLATDPLQFRPCTLDEWVGYLQEGHPARVEYEKLKGKL
jgi:hypothetical protein